MLSAGLCVPRALAKSIRERLARIDPPLLCLHLVPVVSETDITFPIDREPDTVWSECTFVPSLEFASKKRSRVSRPKALSFAERVREILTEDESADFQKSYEMVGSIAVINVCDTLVHRQSEIAECLLSSCRRARTVVKKVGHCSSEFRTSSFEILAGEATLRTVHKEHGLSFVVQIDRVFFSSRISQERFRLAKIVASEEIVFVPFCGVGPFVLVLARLSGCRAVGMELNPAAVALARENLELNSLGESVRIVEGDVRSEETLREVLLAAEGLCGIDQTGAFSFHRVVAPMPRTDMWQELLFPILRLCCRSGTVFHLYDHLNESDAIAKFELMADAARKCQIGNLELLQWLRVGQQHSPTISRICYDFQVREFD